MADIGNKLGGWRRQLSRAVRRHGLIGLCGLAAERLARAASRLRPSVRAELRARNRRAAAFDEQFGVDTAGLIHPTELGVRHPNQVHAVSYRGSDPEIFQRAMAALPIDFRRFVFIDFGSGKGRALLLAAQFPFKRVVGVEFSEELHSIAQNNIRRVPGERLKCKQVESVCLDALDFPLPDECLVCYFFNPFDATLMAKVLSNIRLSFLRNPREIYVVYYNPREAHLLDAADCFRGAGGSGSVRVWQAVSPGSVLSV